MATSRTSRAIGPAAARCIAFGSGRTRRGRKRTRAHRRYPCTGSGGRSSRPTDRSSMTPVDYVIVLICVVSAGIGLWRGFVKEALSLLTLLAAIWLAWRFAGLVEPALGAWAGSPEVRIWTARIIVFVLVL